MSRYTKIQTDGKIVSYGYDHATGYWIDVQDGEDKRGEPNIILDESSFLTKMSKYKMIELMGKYQLPQRHINCVILDLPF